MDIWKWAEDYSWGADYMDPSTGRIYACQEYHRSVVNGIPMEGIPVYDSGVLIGYIRPKKG